MASRQYFPIAKEGLHSCRNLASEKAELAEMVQQLEGKLTVASAESKEAAKATKQLQEELEASHTDRSACCTL